tara:strand:+ start:160 stop:504 length:345 start_codon:yes stop_codon:yes gene_type:complete
MKVITKIVEYLPDTQQIVIKLCRLHSHKTIDEHRTFAIEISDLDMLDNESFIDTLIYKVKHLIQEQDENQPVLDDNTPIEIDGELDIQNLVGKVIEGKIYHRETRLLKMRRVEL